MQRWEYHIITANVEWERASHSYRGQFSVKHAGLSNAELKKLSHEGWEMIYVIPLVSPPTIMQQVGATMAIQYIFRRPKSETGHEQREPAE
jgi:hypothetical protein